MLVGLSVELTLILLRYHEGPIFCLKNIFEVTEVAAVFTPERAIAGIPRYNQRWPPEKRKKGQFGPFLLQDCRLNTGIIF